MTWSEHVLPTDVTGTADTWNAEEAQVYPDEENNVHAMWMGVDDLPYYSYSLDQGNSWSDPLMIAPPGLNGTGFPAVAAGDSGRVAFAYLGDTGGDTWNGYISVMTDSFSEMPLITTVQVNDFGDPLSLEAECGYNRCGGFGDFIDILVDSHGATEGAPAYGASEIIIDITSTGSTLKANQLKRLDSGTILKSQACIFASFNSAWNKSKLDMLREILGLLEKNMLDQVEEKIEMSNKLMRFTKKLSVSPEEINGVLSVKSGSKIKQKLKAPSIISRPNIGITDIIEKSEPLKGFIKEHLIIDEAIEQVEIDIKYSGYINREKENADKLKRLEHVKIPDDIDYLKFSSLSSESKEKLNGIRPANIGQAARISGIKPSDI